MLNEVITKTSHIKYLTPEYNIRNQREGINVPNKIMLP